jgi:flagellar FliJ protein
MSVAKAFQFDFLLRRAQDKREQAALSIGEATQQLQRAQERHVQISQYREEYRDRLAEMSTRGMRVHQWNDFQLFLGKLDAAIDQHQLEVLRCHALLERAKGAWLECEREVKAYEALRKRHDARVALVEARLEQRLGDEWVATRQQRNESE